MHVKKLHFTAHAKQRQSERELSEQKIRDVVNYPDIKKQVKRGSEGGFIYKFTKTIEDKVLVVVAEVRKDTAWILTGYEKV